MMCLCVVFDEKLLCECNLVGVDEGGCVVCVWNFDLCYMVVVVNYFGCCFV